MLKTDIPSLDTSCKRAREMRIYLKDNRTPGVHLLGLIQEDYSKMHKW